MSKKPFAAALAAFCLLVFSAFAAAPKPLSPFHGMRWRLIGPFRGGRVVAVTGIPGNATTFYFGAVAGGVWKTTDAGQTWKPEFQHQAVSSIGAIAVAPSDPNIVYAGTGEADIRGDISYGDGVYKSIDGGKTWRHLGLTRTQRIGALIVDPKNARRLFVAALGDVFGPSTHRGLYRSLDGGRTWQKVLYVNNRTGAIDVVFDPDNAHILYAAMWQADRTPWGMTSGGPGSGLYKSTDGGTTWKRLSGHGLPGGVLGKISVSVSGADPDRVYALIEAKKGGLYVSNNAGRSWHLVNSHDSLRQRAWYFTDVYADPKAVDTVYVLNTSMLRSTDGGRTFKNVGAPHGDNHDLWIDPTDPQRMINGNDGGATITENGGRSWSTLNNQPTAEFYHVATDSRFHFYVYGAQQDNSTVAIASTTDRGVITNKDWYSVGGGESGWVVPEPGDPNIVYAGSYDGLITRWDRKTGQEQDINPWPDNPMGSAAAGLKYRFQWTAPIMISPFAPHNLYFGGNVLFKSTDQGQSWTVISPDLTRNDKAKQASSGGPITQDNTSAEYYDTIFCLAESPVRRGVLWAGSDDGLVHVTRDGGRHWANVTPPTLPKWTKISIIEASHFAPGAAYVAANGEKSDDFHPYIFKTSDYGRTWTRIVNGLPPDVYVHVVRQDPVRRDLLFAGTEQGIFYSLNDGAEWHSLQLNLPTAPVRDIAVHGSELVVATHGRAFWILDDITPLRQFQPAIAAAAVHLYRPRTAYRSRSFGFFFRHLQGVGQGAPGGAIVDYWLKSKPKGPVTLKILTASGQVVDSYSTARKKAPAAGGFFARFLQGPKLPDHAGLNRFVWNERYPNPKPIIPPIGHWGFAQGVLATPGHYQIQLTAAGRTYTEPLVIQPDPRVRATAADYQRQFALAQQIAAKVSAIDQAVNQMRAVEKQLAALQGRIAAQPRAHAVLVAAKALHGDVRKVVAALADVHIQSGEDALNYPIRLNDKYANLLSTVEGSDNAPTRQSYAVYRYLNAKLRPQLAAWRSLQQHQLLALNRLMQKDGVLAIAAPLAAGPHRAVASAGKP